MIQSKADADVFVDGFIHPAEYIKKNYLTYQEAADLFNVELSTIYRWLSGQVVPSKKYFRDATRYHKEGKKSA